jgi:hypothetical protein
VVLNVTHLNRLYKSVLPVCQTLNPTKFICLKIESISFIHFTASFILSIFSRYSFARVSKPLLIESPRLENSLLLSTSNPLTGIPQTLTIVRTIATDYLRFIDKSLIMYDYCKLQLSFIEMPLPLINPILSRFSI